MLNMVKLVQAGPKLEEIARLLNELEEFRAKWPDDHHSRMGYLRRYYELEDIARELLELPRKIARYGA